MRIEVANAGDALKPDMFADVVLRRELGDALFVPESVVLRPGERQIVFLDLGDGTLVPREIETVGARRGRLRRALAGSPRATGSSPRRTSSSTPSRA